LYHCDTNIVAYFPCIVKAPETEEFLRALFFDYAVQILNSVTSMYDIRAKDKIQKSICTGRFSGRKGFPGTLNLKLMPDHIPRP
jgi:hypothetical protein